MQPQQRSIRRREFLKLVSAAGGLAAVGALTACAPSAPSAPAAKPTDAPAAKPGEATKPAQAAPAAKVEAKGTATVIQGPELRPMDPMVEIPSTTKPTLDIYDPLLWKGDDLKLRPHLATAWKVEDNGLRLRLTLREGVKFHDGSALTAEDVQFNLMRAKDPKIKSFHTKYLGALKEVKIVDKTTVDLILSEFDNTLPGRLSLIGIGPMKVVQEYGDEKFALTPVGTGPFRVKEWIRGQQLVLEANKDYWGTPPRIATVIWKSLPEAATRTAAAQTGSGDLVVSIPPALAPQVDSGGKGKVEFIRSLRNFWIVMNAYKPPYDNLKVRQAMNHAVNMDLYIKTILDGKAYRTAGIWGPNVSGYDDSIKPYEYNPDKAKQLLAEAGFASGFDTRLTYSTDGTNPGLPEVIQAVAVDLGKVGVRVKLDPVEQNTYISKYVTVFNPDAELWTHSNANNTAEADYNLTTNVYSKGRGPERTGFYWPTPKDLDEAILAGRKIVDEKQADAHYKAVYERIVDEAVFIFGYDQTDSYATTKRLTWKARPDEMALMRDASVAD